MKALSFVLKLVGWLLIVGLLIFLLVKHLSVFCIGAYTIVGLFVLISASVSESNRGKDPGNLESVQYAISLASTSKLARFRVYVSDGCLILAKALLWPISIVIGLIWMAKSRHKERIDLRNPISMLAADSLEFPMLYQELMSFLALFLIWVGAQLTGLAMPGWLCWLFYANLSLMQLAFFFAPIAMTERLRKSALNPHLVFILLTVSIGATIYILANAMDRQDFPSLAVFLEKVLDFHHLAITIFEEKSYSILNICILVNIILLTIGFLDSVLHIKHFARDAEDYEFVANSFAVLGWFSDSLKWIKKSPTSTNTSEMLALVCYTALNQQEESLKHLQKLWIAMSLDSDKQNNREFFLLIRAFYYPMPSYVMKRLVSEALSTAESAARAFTVLMVGGQRVGFDEVRAMADAELMERWPTARIATTAFVESLKENPDLELISSQLASIDVAQYGEPSVIMARSIGLTILVQRGREDARNLLNEWADKISERVNGVMESDLATDDKDFFWSLMVAYLLVMGSQLPERNEELSYLMERWEQARGGLTSKVFGGYGIKIQR